MQAPARNLIVALLVLLAYVPANHSRIALGQDANRVIIRAAVSQPPFGRVPARVTISKSRVRVGEWVIVNLDAPAGVNRPLFRINFGDGREEVTRNRQIDHKYGKVGHYDVHAWVESDLSPPLPVPRVSLSVDQNSIALGKPVTFSAQLANNYRGVRYRFVFGDKDQTAWQDQPQTSHAYSLARTFSAHVDIGAEENGSFKLLGSSRPRSVQVNTQRRDSVILVAVPTTVEVGRTVIFYARASSRDPNISYRFVFGDGAATDWQTSSQSKHDYASPNTYHAYVQIGSGGLTAGRTVVTSARKPIVVTGSQQQRLAVDLNVNPTNANTETVVTFTARANPRDSNIRYRFFYGDGASSDWQADSRSKHKYSAGNTYFAYVEAGRLINSQVKTEVTSRRRQIAVTSIAPPTPTPTPTPTSKPTPTSTPTPTPTPRSSPTPASSPSPTPGVSPSPSPSGSPASSPGSSPSASPAGSPSSSPGSSPFSSPDDPTRSITDPTRGDGDLLGQNWWKYLLILVLIAFVGYRTFKVLFAPRPTFRPVPDAGDSSVDEVTNALAINSQIHLNPDIADGLYSVNTEEPNLVRSITTEDD
ncbi:MAG TPA: PKD domain-containing protein [Pyrinomonadaceae bacterium]|nr:PKD domain-containing protein [Pyrinomonadaceae bacterium]